MLGGARLAAILAGEAVNFGSPPFLFYLSILEGAGGTEASKEDAKGV